MIFNQFAFLLAFLPIVLGMFFWPGLERWRPAILIAASFVFYGASGLRHAVILALDITVVYAVMARPTAVGNRLSVAAAISVPILTLAFFKYGGFFYGTIAGLAPAANLGQFSLFRDVLVPAGISFFTFQVIAFAIDRYRGEIRDVPSFVNFALYVSFFPQLVAGPIVRLVQVREAIERLPIFRATATDFAEGGALLVIGLGYKVLLADGLHGSVLPLAGAPGELSSLSAIYVLLAYSFQIYFDFFGYSLCAIGLGRFFGFRFPDNFLRPYESLNPREFWRRWHVTLGYWIRDYLYLPLGGNRRYIRNILIVFAAAGLWHGAGWSFVAWGLYHGSLVVFYKALGRFWDTWPKILQRSLTFILVSAAWTLFLFDFNDALVFWRSAFSIGVAGIGPAPDLGMWVFLLASAAVCFGVQTDKIATASAAPWREVTKGAGLSVLFVAVLLLVDQSQTFIYFRF